jgi:ketosteroid isomerase-like protein
MNASPLYVARACLQAYVNKDRAALEALLAADFHFTSPIDNSLDRAAYLSSCWPNSESMTSCEIIHGVELGERSLIVYEAETSNGKRFRNSEVHTVRGGKLIEVEVYFGWNLPP